MTYPRINKGTPERAQGLPKFGVQDRSISDTKKRGHGSTQIFTDIHLRSARMRCRAECQDRPFATLGDRASFVVRFLNVLHRSLYRNSDRVVVLGRDMLRLVHRKLGIEAGNVSTITHWADSDQIMPLDRNNNLLLRKLKLEDKFVIQYSGNMGRTHDLEVLIRCARILQQDLGIHFLFIGTGAKEHWLRKATQDLGLGNVTILPPQPRTELAQSLNACDLAVISFVKGMSGVSVPSRMYNILGAGKPILAIADADSELAQVILEAHVGWLVQPGAEEKAVQAIREAASNKVLLEEMSQRALAIVLKQYTKLQVMDRYEKLVRSVASSGNSSGQEAT